MTSKIQPNGSTSVTQINSVDGQQQVAPKQSIQTATDSSSSAGGTGSSTALDISANQPFLITSKMTPAEIAAMIESICYKARQQRKASNDTQVAVDSKSSYDLREFTFTQPGSKTTDARSIKVILGEGKTELSLQTQLSDAINDPIEKQLKKKFPHLTLNQASNFLNEQVQNAFLAVVAPALAVLGSTDSAGNVKNLQTLFRSDNPAIQTAIAAQFTKYVIGLINDGVIRDFAQSQFQDDPAAAKQLEAIVGTELLKTGIELTGESAGLAGLGKQELIQAQVLRDQEAIGKSDPDRVIKYVLDQWAEQGKITAQQRREYESKGLEKALQDALEVSYKSHGEMIAALTAHLEEKLGDKDLASSFASGIDAASFALVTDGKSIYSPSLDLLALNLQTAERSVAAFINRAFANSIEANEASARAKEVVDRVLNDAKNGKYKTELEIRNALASDLRVQFRGLELTPEHELTEEQIGIITNDAAAAANFGLPIDSNNPLFNSQSSAIVPPWLYSQTVQSGYQNTLHVAPNSDLGHDLDLVAGITGNGPIGSLNAYYENSDADTKSYLNTPSTQAAAVALLETTDTTAVVKNLATLYAKPPEKGHKDRFV